MTMPPALYDGHHRTYTEDIPFWLNLARQAQGPVLELGCGTGRVLLPLLGHDIPAWGLDYDANMLAYLQAHTPPVLRRALRLVQADLRAPWPFPAGAFALVFMPCNTFSLFDAPTRDHVLSQAARVLRPGGRLALSLPNATYLRHLPAVGESEPEDYFTHPLTGNPVQVSSAWERTGEHFVLTWHYDHLWPDGEIERYTVHQRHHLVSRPALQAACRRAGLQPLAWYGDFDGNPASSGSPYLILLATRR